MVTALRRLRRSEQGFSVIESVVTMGILGLALATIFSSLDVFTRHTTSTQERSLMLGETRNAVETVTRDLRAANPIVALDPVKDYDTSVSFSVYCANVGVSGCDTGNQRAVRYRVRNNQLEQQLGTATKVLVGPRGSSSLPVTSRQGAIVNGESQPVFKYFKKDGIQLLTSPTTAAAPASMFRDCAQYVEIHLVVVAEPGEPTSTINLVTRADLRNFNQVTAC
jgi:type II secretory pathway component PulJ